MAARQETCYFEAVCNEEIDAQIDRGPEDLRMCAGTILVSFPPPKSQTEGGIHIPDPFQKTQDIGRVVSTPDDPNCPVEVGDTVLVRHMSGDPIKLFKREDLRLIQYTNDCASEILAYYKGN